jgi:hypothetical protein
VPMSFRHASNADSNSRRRLIMRGLRHGDGVWLRAKRRVGEDLIAGESVTSGIICGC